MNRKVTSSQIGAFSLVFFICTMFLIWLRFTGSEPSSFIKKTGDFAIALGIIMVILSFVLYIIIEHEERK